MAEFGAFPVYGGNGINGYHDEFMFEAPVITIGRVGVYCGAIHVTRPHSWVTDNALYVTERNGSLDFDYLATALELANLNQYAGQAAQPLLSGSRINPVSILVPPRALQAKFSARKQLVADRHKGYLRSMEALTNLQSSLQLRAFEGGL
jgi:type I restriction enzyme S subunit